MLKETFLLLQTTLSLSVSTAVSRQRLATGFSSFKREVDCLDVYSKSLLCGMFNVCFARGADLVLSA